MPRRQSGWSNMETVVQKRKQLSKPLTFTYVCAHTLISYSQAHDVIPHSLLDSAVNNYYYYAGADLTMESGHDISGHASHIMFPGINNMTI